MSLFLDSINPSKAIRLPNLSVQQMVVGYAVDNQFIVSSQSASNDSIDNTISESANNNNGISWIQTTVPISLGTVWEIGSFNNFGSQIILIKTRTSNNLYNLYRLSDIKMGPPYPSPIYSLNKDYSIINNSDKITLVTSGSSGNGSYIYDSGTVIAGKIVFETLTIPYAGSEYSSITKNYFTAFNNLYYTKNNLWANPGIINLSAIGVTSSSRIFENAESSFLSTRGVAFAFANNFTKLLKIQKSRIPDEPVIELVDSSPPINNSTDIQASITSDGKIWVCYRDFSVNQTRRLFSPNFGGEWIQLSNLPVFTGSFYTSLSGLNQIVTTSQDGSYISTNYGY
jgi:hypothetical protein